MFEETLKDSLLRIFDFKKASFAAPGETPEQECLFIEIESAMPTFKDGRQFARVIGRVHVYGNADKLPYGYFAKKLEQADPDDTKDLFFSELDQNTNIYTDLCDRSASFTYFFDSQFDPAVGTITSIETEVTDS